MTGDEHGEGALGVDDAPGATDRNGHRLQTGIRGDCAAAAEAVEGEDRDAGGVELLDRGDLVGDGTGVAVQHG